MMLHAFLPTAPRPAPAAWLQVYSSSVTPQVKRQCLTTISKMLHFNSAATLAALLEDLPLSALLAALLAARDSTVVAFGMQVRRPLRMLAGARGLASGQTRRRRRCDRRCR